ncbi:hypothetical protein AQUCO_02200305v1 [Aquilegia coerulea]|uniref:BHLH domain-containing protein n=1 Tax=Aquilegia coerulea TaxID=218851 RepID=A0A2G5DE82_AQUCA|nr:hypothetical protein AQUCO_02200305v1 [Aquilegia coerulea]
MTVDDWETISSEGKSSGSSGAQINARERHILAERERRKSMRELMLSLHSLLPQANTVRKEQSSILDEIIKYIPLVAAQLESLQKRRDSVSLNRSNNKTAVSPTIQVSDRNSSDDSLHSSDCDIKLYWMSLKLITWNWLVLLIVAMEAKYYITLNARCLMGWKDLLLY